MEITEFQKLSASKKGIRRGRPATLTPQQRQHRAEVAKVKNRLRNEARRRAHAVLQDRYAAEYEALMEAEYRALQSEDRYRIPAESEFTLKTTSVTSPSDISL
jgi:hypothetical protein